MSICPYCHTDRDGYVQHLPREGIGNIHIWRDWSSGEWIMTFSGKYKTKAAVKINFCPMCGRELKKGHV